LCDIWNFYHLSEKIINSFLKCCVGDTLLKWECMICGYVYDPEIGDPDSGIPPGTPFEELPDDWVCPECGASKDEFQPVEE